MGNGHEKENIYVKVSDKGSLSYPWCVDIYDVEKILIAGKRFEQLYKAEQYVDALGDAFTIIGRKYDMRGQFDGD